MLSALWLPCHQQHTPAANTSRVFAHTQSKTQNTLGILMSQGWKFTLHRLLSQAEQNKKRNGCPRESRMTIHTPFSAGAVQNMIVIVDCFYITLFSAPGRLTVLTSRDSERETASFFTAHIFNIH